MKNLEILIFFKMELLGWRVSRGVRPVNEQKPVFCTKNSQMTKFSSNFLKFGLGVPNQVPCSFKEALAKIWSGSGLFLLFCALANLLGSGDCNFDISLKPWHCAKSEGGVSSLACCGQKPLSVFPKWSCRDEGSHGGWDPLMEKTCKLPKKNQNLPKMLKISWDLCCGWAI